MKKILILCTGNSCRSQIAEGYLRFFAKEKAEIFSAGIETHGVNKDAIFVMKQDGIDISKHTSNNINEYINIEFDYVITVCDNAKENCPLFISKAKKIHYNFEDPSKLIGNKVQILNKFIQTRDKIKEFSKIFIQENIF